MSSRAAGVFAGIERVARATTLARFSERDGSILALLG